MTNTDELVDERPEIEPTFFSYRELGDSPEANSELFREMADKMKAEGVTFGRFTTVSPEYPKPPYPDGLYVEGWKDLPPEPWEQAPFNFPLTAAEPQP